MDDISSTARINFKGLDIWIKESSCLIGLYDKRMDSNFSVKFLANWKLCFCKTVFRNILISQYYRTKNTCNNEEYFQNFSKIIHVAAVGNDYPV